MNWTVVLEASILILNLVVIGFLKWGAGGYGGEKGKNLARQEDLSEKILPEVAQYILHKRRLSLTSLGTYGVSE